MVYKKRDICYIFNVGNGMIVIHDLDETNKRSKELTTLNVESTSLTNIINNINNNINSIYKKLIE